MKKIMLAITFIVAVSSLSFAQMKPDSSHMHMKMAHQKYTCSMHPDVVRNRPGKCPKCGMKLISMKKKGKQMQTTNNEMKM